MWLSLVISQCDIIIYIINGEPNTAFRTIGGHAAYLAYDIKHALLLIVDYKIGYIPYMNDIICIQCPPADFMRVLCGIQGAYACIILSLVRPPGTCQVYNLVMTHLQGLK